MWLLACLVVLQTSSHRCVSRASFTYTTSVVPFNRYQSCNNIVHALSLAHRNVPPWNASPVCLVVPDTALNTHVSVCLYQWRRIIFVHFCFLWVHSCVCSFLSSFNPLLFSQRWNSELAFGNQIPVPCYWEKKIIYQMKNHRWFACE